MATLRADSAASAAAAKAAAANAAAAKPVAKSATDIVAGMVAGTTAAAASSKSTAAAIAEKPAPVTPAKVSTNQTVAQKIADYAATNPAPKGTHYGTTLGADGNPILYKDQAAPAAAVTQPAAAATAANSGSLAQTELAKQQITQAKQESTRTALQDLTAQLSSVGLKGLVDVINAAILNNQTAAQIADTVRGSNEYATRFPGMAALAKAGRAVNEATYISMEQGYLQTLHAYGLDTSTFGSTSALGTYISNMTSPSEFNSRVDAAANRVEKNPDVLASLQNYYGVDKATAIGYILDPKQGIDLINKQVRASEIGASALAAGFSQFSDKGAMAESYIQQIGNEDLVSLKKEFGQAGILAQQQERLSEIEGTTYKQNDAIQAAIVGNQQAILESQRRAARETQTRFGGSGSSVSRVSTVGAI
jgi:hypothetical protein